MSTIESSGPSPATASSIDTTGAELKRGAFLNTIAIVAANFRGVFTFLVARLLGPVALGLYSVAWSTTDIISKIGILGLDNAIITFIAQSEAVGDHARSRVLFRLAAMLAFLQCVILATVVVFLLRSFGDRLGLQREMISALALTVCALPGVALYRISTAVSRGMKIMKHDIYSRGITESIATTLAFLIALAIGFNIFSPEVAAIVGTAAGGVVAVTLASKLFRGIPNASSISYGDEARRLLGYAAPISAYQLLNTFISRLDLIMLGFFVGRAPGVSLVTVGIYGAVVSTANGLRQVNQVFNPIFTPIVAGMTATADHERAAATYAHLAQWMLWILLPLVVVMALAGGTILLIYGPVFQEGNVWLSIVALASALNAFVSLGETVIMVQRPRLNLLHSSITCAVAVAALLLLIPKFGALGAALGILLVYVVQGILRYLTLRFVFRWKDSWSDLRPPVLAAVIALIPALVCRLMLNGIAGQIVSAVVFLALFAGQWWRYRSATRI